MPSKNLKIVKKNDSKHKENIVEEKQHKHPFLWGFSIAILVLIVISFIGAPLFRGLLSKGGELIFGQYDGKDIKYTPNSYFARQLDAYVQKFQNTSNANTNYQYQTYQIWKSAFDSTVFHMAILDSAEKSGLYISDHKIDKALTQYGPYMDNGKFSPELYKVTPSSEKYATRQLYREELTQQQYLSDIQSTLTSKNEIEFIKSMSSPERNFEYVAFKFDKYPDSEVISYGKENKKLFTKINLNRISLKDDKKAAQAIYDKLKENPAQFEELAQNQSTDIYAEKGGDMGWVKYDSLKGDFADTKDLDSVFNLKQDELSSLIKTPYGYSIYRCNKEKTDPDFTSKEDIDDIRNYILTAEKGKIEDYFTAEAEKFIKTAKKDGFDKAGNQFGLTYHVTDYFPINYGNSYFMKQIRTLDDNKDLAPVATDERALTALFSVKKNELTEPIILDNSIIVARMIDERNVDPKDLAFIDTYYTYLVNQFRQEELYKMFLSSDKLKNNFLQVFSENILKNK